MGTGSGGNLFQGTLGSSKSLFHDEDAKNESFSIVDNLVKLGSKFPVTKSGYFGEKGKSKNNSIRNIQSKDPVKTAKEFFIKSKIGINKIIQLPNNKGKMAVFPDGSRIVYREISSSDGTPVIEISVKTHSDRFKSQKIHFVRGH